MLRSTRPKRIDEGYLDFLRGKNCIFCGAHPVDPHHLIARGWREPFRDDYVALPACRSCHVASHGFPLSEVLARHGMTEKELVVSVVDLLVEYFAGHRSGNGNRRDPEEDHRRRLIKAAFKKRRTAPLALAPRDPGGIDDHEVRLRRGSTSGEVQRPAARRRRPGERRANEPTHLRQLLIDFD